MNLDKIKRLAKQVSKTSDHHSFKIGSVLFNRKTILASRPNFLFKTHPVYNRLNPLKTLHSEAACVLSARHKEMLTGASICVYRERKDGGMGMAKPCVDCMSILKLYGVKKVVYSSEDGWCEESI